ncbi:MAG: Trm112 family protein [Alphaproteobacteria bacterium]
MDKNTLSMLVCPITHTPLKYDEKNQELISEKLKVAFPIRDGIPIMLVEEARKLD